MSVGVVRSHAVTCLVLMLSVGVHAAVAAPPVGADEYSVRAAAVVNLARFVVWSTPTVERFAICVTGDPGLAAAMSSATEGKKIDGLPVRVLSLTGGGDEANCRVIYIGRDERHAADVLARAGRGPLTISDRPEFVREGGLIRLFVRDDRLRFEINQQAAERVGIKIPAQVLALAGR